MTDIMAPLPPAAAATPSPRAEPVSRAEAPFGPALAEAQRHDAGRSHTSERASESSEGDSDTSAPADNEGPEAERSSSTAEEPSTSDSDSNVDGRSVAGVESPRTALPHAPEPAEPAEAATTETSDALIGRPLDHPTAKGDIGDGGPSTDPTVERAAPPDNEPMAMAGPPSSEMTPARASAVLTQSLEDAPVVLAVSGPSAGTAPSTTDDVTPTGTVGTTPVNEGAPTVQGIERSVGASTAAESMQSPVATVDDGEGSSAPQAVATSTEVPGRASVVTLDGSESSGERPAVVTTERVGSIGTAQTAEAASAAGADPTRTVEGARLTQPVSAPPSAAPTAGPLDAAVGSLWDDVRIGLERMRTSADGQEVRIRLRPAELGELIVQVRTNGDQVAVRLVTTSAAAQQALVDDRLRLAAELARAGFNQGSVDIGQEDATPFGQSPRDTGDERGRGRTVSEPAPVATERGRIEQRDPILTPSSRRPGRHAYSTINLTL